MQNKNEFKEPSDNRLVAEMNLSAIRKRNPLV